MGSADFVGTERFQIKRRLGAGGMGVVYEAFDRERRQSVALKTLKRVDAQAVFRFKREFRSLHDIEHPNLISLYELSEEAGELFFTMELVRGVDFLTHVSGHSTIATSDTEVAQASDSAVTPSADTLRADLHWHSRNDQDSTTYDEPRLRAALAQLVSALAALHAAGKVHRDVKPSNILVTDDGRVVLLDFGLVTHTAEQGQSTQANLVGTAEYMAPEQAVSGDVGPAADWYSVGVLLYEALTTRLPHRGRTALETLMKKQQRPAAPPRQWIASLPKDLDALCVELLKREPNERPDAEVILRQLGVATDEAALGTRRTTSTKFTQTTPFVGRHAELERLRASFDQSLDGSLVTVVEGDSGVGKSELVRQFVQGLSADVPNVVVLAGRCYERESVAYKAFDGVIDELSRYMIRLAKAEAAALLPLQAGLLSRLFPVLQRVEAIASAPKGAEIPEPQEMRRQMFGALRELFVRLTMRHPVVLVIDDLQWTDADSMTLLQEILGDQGAPNLLLITTMRPMPAQKRDALLASMGPIRRSLIALAELSESAARELASILLPSFDDGALANIAAEAGGHPLFIVELARYAQGGGKGLTLDQNLWQRISQLPSRLLAVLQLVCVAGTPITQETAANAAEMSHAELAEASAGLRTAYLVRTGGVRKDDLIEPYHDRIREIVANHLGDDVRIRCHNRLAVALEQSGAATTNPHALVRHAAAAGDAPQAAQYAEIAAHNAVAAMAFDQAAEFYRAALDFHDHDEHVARELQLRLGGALVNAGRGSEAAAAFLAAAVGADTATRLECERQAAGQLLLSGHIEEGLSAVQALLTEIDLPFPTTPRRVLASLVWHRFKLRVRGLGWRERQEGEFAKIDLVRFDAYRAAGDGLNFVDTVRAADFHARGLLLALRTGEKLRVGRALAHEAAFVALQGPRHFSRSRMLLGRAQKIADETRDANLLGTVLGLDGAVSYFEGRFRRAEEVSAAAEAQLAAIPDTIFLRNAARMFRLYSLRQMGAFAETGLLLGRYLRDAARLGDLYAETTYRRYGHLVWLSRDLPERCRLELEQTSWVPPIGSVHLQHWYELEAQAELAMYEGASAQFATEALPRFKSFADSLLMRLQIVRSNANWMLARLLLAAAGPNAAGVRRRIARLARSLGRERVGYAEVFSSLLIAGLAARDRNLEASRTALTNALEKATSLDMFLCAESARYRLGQLLGGDEGAAMLTQAETWMKSEGVIRPDLLANVIAPGFAEL